MGPSRYGHPEGGIAVSDQLSAFFQAAGAWESGELIVEIRDWIPFFGLNIDGLGK